MSAPYDVRDGRFVAAMPREWVHVRLADTGVLANFDDSHDGRIAALMSPPMADDQSPNHATFSLNFQEMLRRQDATSAKE
jgi:hypothetical protein